MTRKRFLLWLSLALFVLLGGCARDKDFVIDATSNIIYPCKLGRTWWGGDFGQYYVEGNGCEGAGKMWDYDYLGPPKGAVAFRWKVIYEDPEKEGLPYEQQVIKRRYFYAESHAPIEMPPRGKDHGLYEVHISLGPRVLITKEAVTDPSMTIKPFSVVRGDTWYEVGDIDTLYYFIRSRPRKWSEEFPSAREVRDGFHAIKGIELTEPQYMTIACEKIGYDKCKAHLEEDTPGLTADQLAYLRAARKK